MKNYLRYRFQYDVEALVTVVLLTSPIWMFIVGYLIGKD